ncbi:MAG: hypothetical protein CML69_00935 [Rhodobacteraceae bacterium]|nr:hypothetical protein [Paracoccaceae bacterium]
MGLVAPAPIFYPIWDWMTHHLTLEVIASIAIITQIGTLLLFTHLIPERMAKREIRNYLKWRNRPH